MSQDPTHADVDRIIREFQELARRENLEGRSREELYEYIDVFLKIIVNLKGQLDTVVAAAENYMSKVENQKQANALEKSEPKGRA